MSPLQFKDQHLLLLLNTLKQELQFGWKSGPSELEKMSTLPTSMKALRYEEPRKHSIVQVPLPVVRDGDILIKGLFSYPLPTSTI